MTITVNALVTEAPDPDELARFWGELLERADVVAGPDDMFLPGTPTQVGLRFIEGRPPGTGPNRVHLHVTSDGERDQDAVVERALDLGARHLDVGQLPDEGHIVLADPGGNEFCVIERGNRFLAGCGTLGEVACDGTREVGLFWSEALGWPLVWEHEEETAVQAPVGGTKIAWGGPPVPPKAGRNRHWLELGVDPRSVQDEARRLVNLGATTRESGRDGVLDLFDPDGNEFQIISV